MIIKTIIAHVLEDPAKGFVVWLKKNAIVLLICTISVVYIAVKNKKKLERAWENVTSENNYIHTIQRIEEKVDSQSIKIDNNTTRELLENSKKFATKKQLDNAYVSLSYRTEQMLKYQDKDQELVKELIKTTDSLFKIKLHKKVNFEIDYEKVKNHYPKYLWGNNYRMLPELGERYE